jgi:hypothetical protein
VAQIMYIHVSTCENYKIKFKKTTVRYHVTLLRRASIKKEKKSFGKDVKSNPCILLV